MMYPRLLSVAFATLALGLASNHASAQVLLNGGFELPLIASGGSSGTAPTDWTDSSDTIFSNGNGVVGNTPYGSQFVVLLPGDALSQTISGFTANQTYVLGFDFEYQVGDPLDLTASVTGAANASEPFTLGAGGPEGNGTIPFQSGVLVFTASASGSATISFEDDGAAVALDNVGLYGNIKTAPPTTPEPSTYAEMLIGMLALAGFGLMRRRSVRA
jgi:hypothetical protein